jgi:hypothetical protein
MTNLQQEILKEAEEKLSQNTTDPIGRVVFRSDLNENELFELVINTIKSALQRQMEEVKKCVPEDMTNTNWEEFERKVGEELGSVSALFVSQECKGTEIIMPIIELKECLDRISLYAFSLLEQEKKKWLEALPKEVEEKNSEINQGWNACLKEIKQQLTK